MRRTPLIAAAALVAAMLGTAASPAQAATPAYDTLLFSRSPVVALANCTPLPGAVPLDQTLAELHQEGIAATGSVVVGDVAETTEACTKGMGTPSWADLADWRDRYDYTVTDAGWTHDDFTLMTPEQQVADSCGSLPPLAAHGHTKADSLFSPASGRITPDEQLGVVSKCFANTRVYGKVTNTRTTIPKHLVRALGVTGGACGDPSAACYSMASQFSATRYTQPDQIAALWNSGPGSWSIVQVYALLVGSSRFGDCTATNPLLHWTLRPEDYCLLDLQAAVAKTPATRFVNPATVAAAWK